MTQEVISEKEIMDRIEKLKDDFLRDIEEIHKDTYEKVRGIMRSSDDDEMKRIKKDLNALKS